MKEEVHPGSAYGPEGCWGQHPLTLLGVAAEVPTWSGADEGPELKRRAGRAEVSGEGGVTADGGMTVVSEASEGAEVTAEAVSGG